jgi:F-type H+-transporting ATPase subunit delta
MKPTRQARREAAQLFRICLVNGLLDEGRARNAVQRLVAEKPRGYLATLSLFRRLVKLDADRHTAKIESAVALPPDVQANVKNELTKVYGPGLTANFSDNPSLIGGMRIQVGSDVYDGSVQARLAALQESF